MKDLKIYLCPICGHGGSENGQCPECEVPLAEYDNTQQNEYRANQPLENTIRAMSTYKWFV